MERILISAEDGYTLWEEPLATTEMIALLENTTWGSGAVQYKHFNSAERIRHIRSARHFTLRVGSELLAVIVFCSRQLRHAHCVTPGYYIRFFAASPKIKGRGIVGKASDRVMTWIRENEREPSLYYAAVESENFRSRRIVNNVGFQEVAPIRTLGMSRFFPRKITPLRRLSNDEFQQFLPKLSAQYEQHHCWVTDNLNIDPGYWVVEHQGEIVLGAQVHQAFWAVDSLPGFLGHLLPVTPYIPFLNRVFNARDFRFLTIEGLYIKAGYDGELLAFWESLLYQFKQHVMLSWWDERDPIYQYIQQQPNLGLIKMFTQSTKVSFIISNQQLTDEQRTGFQQGPYFIANLDYI